MSNPQIENGYTRIANELLIALAFVKISGQSRQLFDVILRESYGWQQKECTLSLDDFAERTGIKNRSHISRGLSKLVTMRLITKNGNYDGIRCCINKRYSQWECLPKSVTGQLPKLVQRVTKIGTPLHYKKRKLKKEGVDCKTPPKTEDFLTNFPDHFQASEQFKQAWTEWLAHKKQKRSSVTAVSAKKQAKLLAGFSIDVAIQMLEQSMTNGWAGIFELKGKQGSAKDKTQERMDNIKKGMEIAKRGGVDG